MEGVIEEEKDRIKNEVEKMGIPDMHNELGAAGITSNGTKKDLVKRIVKLRLTELFKERGVEDAPISLDDTRWLDSDEDDEVEIDDKWLKATMLKYLQAAKEDREELRAERSQNTKLLTQFLASVDAPQGNAVQEDVVVFKRKFNRLTSELRDQIKEIEINGTKKTYHQLTILVKAAAEQFTDIKRFLDDKIDYLEVEEERKIILLKQKETVGYYQRVISDAEERLHSLKSQDSEDNNSGCLPPGVEAPEFLGQVFNFPSYWDAFCSLVHENSKVSKFYKLHYLRQGMKGSAKGVLDGFDQRANSYDEAVTHVRKRFGRPQVLARHAIQEFLCLESLSNDARTLRSFLDKLVAQKSRLTQEKITLDNFLIQIVESKFPPKMHENWIRKVTSLIETEKGPDWEMLIKFITKEVTTKETLALDKKIDPKGNKLKEEVKPASAHALVSSTGEKGASKCVYCTGIHELPRCPLFLKLDPNERFRIAVENLKGVCRNCLKQKGMDGHPYRYCSEKCPETGCDQYHHQLLHAKIVGSKSLITILNCSSTEHSKTDINSILPTALAILTYKDKQMRVRIALDSLSQKSFVTAEVATILGMTAEWEQTLVVHGFGGKQSIEKCGVVRFLLEPCKENAGFPLEIEAYVKQGKICSEFDPVRLDATEFNYLKELPLADPIPRDEGKVDVLLGAQYYYYVMQGQVISPPDPSKMPFATKTIFGYVLGGAYQDPSFIGASKVKRSGCLISMVKMDKGNNIQPRQRFEILDKKLERFWCQDILGIVSKASVHTKEERKAVEIFTNTVEYDGERYTVHLPFKEDSPSLVNNYAIAKSRLIATERTLSKNLDKREMYEKAIMEYIELGHAKELSPTEIKEMEGKSQYFIPHHPIYRESSVSTKCRIVFDASSKDSAGRSLNDCLYNGPSLLPDIAQVLLRFRTYPIAINADIKKMFLQTNVIPDHHKYQQFLWRHCDNTVPPKQFAMRVLTFGEGPSPFLASSCIHYHAKRTDMIEKFGRERCQRIINDTYMDDVHDGGDNDNEVIQVQEDLMNFFLSGGWELTKFSCNSKEVLEKIPEDHRHPNLVVDLDESNHGLATALGLKWHTGKDTFICNVSEKLLSSKNYNAITKRVILGKLSAIYDVFGFFAPFVLLAKIIVQDLWKSRIDWDTPVDEDIKDRYLEWESELPLLSTIEINRKLHQFEEKQSVQLHGFCDASEMAYGACVYARITDVGGNITTSYIMSKTRVAPIKWRSVAQLELMAAHCLSKLMTYIVDAISSHIIIESCYYWTGSKIVLAWLAKPSSTWKPFIRNRVQEIHDLSSCHWNHIPGKDNPADFHSRGAKLSHLQRNVLYWSGPAWLGMHASEWPDLSPAMETEDLSHIEDSKLKQMKVMVTTIAESYPHMILRISNYEKLIRSYAWALRWLRRKFDLLEQKEINTPLEEIQGYQISELSSQEFIEAEWFVIRMIQRLHYPVEFLSLQNEEKIKRDSKILALDPSWDPVKSLIVGGNRLYCSDLSAEAKAPIILPPKDLFVRKLILHTHIQNAHSPQDTTISILRENYYIVHMRQEVISSVKGVSTTKNGHIREKEAVHRLHDGCTKCRHAGTKPESQKMGILPPERVQVSPAFTHIGLDFTGPVYIKDYYDKTTRKAYILIITCMSSRMIHLELTNDMTCEEFLSALRRMINRRGCPDSILSDNQSTYKKASKLLHVTFAPQLKTMTEQATIQRFLVKNKIRWNFITERSPHRGGFYERLNRSLKEPLRKVLGNARLNYSEIYTILTDIEGALNQRPLTYLGSDAANLRPIAPFYLATGRSLQSLRDVPTNCSIPVNKQFYHLQALQKHFWKRWSTEYLPGLMTRKKWLCEKDVPKIGDVCLIMEENTKRPTWPMGLIVDAIPGRDCLVRTYKLKTAKGFLNRPVNKLLFARKGRKPR